MNPLGMVVALLGAMDQAAALDSTCDKAAIENFTLHCREAVYSAFRTGKGTRDLSGPTGLTTEQFVDTVAEDLSTRMATGKGLEAPQEVKKVPRKFRRAFENID